MVFRCSNRNLIKMVWEWGISHRSKDQASEGLDRSRKAVVAPANVEAAGRVCVHASMLFIGIKSRNDVSIYIWAPNRSQDWTGYETCTLQARL